MCRIPLILAGTSLLALPQPLAGAGSIAARLAPAPAQSTQSTMPDGNLPPSRYSELRTQALAHARLIAGPRLRNPNLASGGLDRNTATALAEQRANRLNRAGLSSPAPNATALLSGSPATLLPQAAPRQPIPAGSPILGNPLVQKSSCTFPAIRAVNGRTTAPIFTPAEPDNHFRISGCGFGFSPGLVRLLPSAASPLPGPGSSPQPIALQLETPGSWTDSYIDVRINPGLSGLPDFNADLVVQLPSGRSVQLTNCQFLAARGEPQLLRSIPAAWVRLDTSSVSTRSIHQVEFESPPVSGEEMPLDASGASAFIARSDPQAFSTGKDIYDLSQLAPGWVAESVQLRVFSPACPGVSKVPVSNGSWETSWSRNGFIVAWAGETCSSPIPPVFNFTLNSSQYAANIWVIGPVGTQPFPNNYNARQP